MVLALCLASCGAPTAGGPSGDEPVAVATPAPAPPASTTAPPTAAERHEPPSLRLGDGARPSGYQIELTLDPRKETFRGKVEIDIEVSRALDILWLNQTDLTIDEASLVSGGRTVPLRVVPGGQNFVGFIGDGPVRPGVVKFRASYQGKLPGHEQSGLFRRKEGDFWYIYSQFEPFDSRRAFPGFDEPNFKVPYQLTLHVAQDHRGFTNTPVVSESKSPDGMKTLRFAPTPPLPSYLVALAVGPFEVVDAGTAGRNKTPIRIITPRGKSGGATYAAQVTGEILVLLEDYFDQPYPYAKLDKIAVPSFLGAMENPGLITYHQELILAEARDETLWRQRGYAGTCAHELAHIWFGDLVTMQWWDDLWLNEAFATWMSAKIIHQWKPEWDGDVNMVRSAGRAMASDSLDSARKIRQPIASKHDIDSAFDGITYGKGAAVLRMFEAWIGEEKFRQGIISYINAHANGNADAADFLAALGQVGGGETVSAFETFIDQSGVPLVTASLSCQAGRKTGKPPVLALSQQRYAPKGSSIDTSRTWKLPVCVEYGAGKARGRTCTLLTDAQAEIALTDMKRCPSWVLPNSDMTGYYRVAHDKSTLTALLRAPRNRFTVPERIGLINGMGAMVKAGTMSRAEALAWVPRLHKERNRHIASSTLGLSYVPREMLPDELKPSYARFINKMYGPWARQLGWKVGPNEPDSVRLIRPRVLALVAHEGGDRALIREARKLVDRWLEDRAAIHPDLVGTAISVATREGDLALWQRFYDQARATTDSKERSRLLRGMAGFEDPEIVKKNLAIMGTDQFKLVDSSRLMWAALFTPANRSVAFGFLEQNFDQLLPRVPRFAASALGFTAGAFCSPEGIARAEKFLRPRITRVQGGPRALDQALERANLCVAQKSREQPSLVKFLKKY